MAERLNSENFESRITQKDKLVLIDFYSDSCVPCKKISPILAELEEHYGDRLYIGKINSAYEPELIERYSVMSAPTLVFFKDGSLIKRLSGAVKKAELESIILENM